MNERLPFDVLSDIFSYYQQQEDVFYPAETLLLVCKFWAEVALSHRAIWARFKIRFGHEPILKMWRKRLPLRLMRSGAHVLLDIDIRSERFDLDEEVLRNARFYSKKCFDKKGSRMSRCRCNDAHAAMITWVFDVLVGNNGELCKRWRTLRIHSGEMARYTVHLGSPVTSLGNAITSPTPSLISLSLTNISVNTEMNTNHTVFPSAPLLQELTLSHSSLPHLPDTSNVRKIEIYDLHITSQNRISLEKSTRMQELAITQASQQIILAPMLHELSQLTLYGATLPSTFERTSMPQLTHLCLSLELEPMLRTR